MNAGYANFSVQEPDASGQVKSLISAGCTKDAIYVSSQREDDKGKLTAALDTLSPGDTLIVCSLDRLARSATQFVTIAADLTGRGVQLRSLAEGINTATTDAALFPACAVLERIEKSTKRGRAMVGMKAARARGKSGGAKERLSAEAQERLVSMYGDGKQFSVQEVGTKFGITRATVYRYLQKHGAMQTTSAK